MVKQSYCTQVVWLRIIQLSQGNSRIVTNASQTSSSWLNWHPQAEAHTRSVWDLLLEQLDVCELWPVGASPHTFEYHMGIFTRRWSHAEVIYTDLHWSSLLHSPAQRDCFHTLCCKHGDLMFRFRRGKFVETNLTYSTHYVALHPLVPFSKEQRRINPFESSLILSLPHSHASSLSMALGTLANRQADHFCV